MSMIIPFPLNCGHAAALHTAYVRTDPTKADKYTFRRAHAPHTLRPHNRPVILSKNSLAAKASGRLPHTQPNGYVNSDRFIISYIFINCKRFFNFIVKNRLFFNPQKAERSFIFNLPLFPGAPNTHLRLKKRSTALRPIYKISRGCPLYPVRSRSRTFFSCRPISFSSKGISCFPCRRAAVLCSLCASTTRTTPPPLL